MSNPERLRVALVMVVVGDLAGSGGAERLFADLHEHSARKFPDGDVQLVTSERSLRRLQAAGRLRSVDNVIALRLGSTAGSGLLGIGWVTARLLWTIARSRFDVVHICLPTPTYVPLAAVLSRMPRRWRPAVTLSVIDCTLASSLDVPPPVGTYERQVVEAHRLYFRWTRLDGIFTWYRSVILAMSSHRLAPTALARAARFSFTNTTRFSPAAKENLIVFAGRLSDQKRPLLFVDAVARLVATAPNLTIGLRVEMYGKGTLERDVTARIEQHGLAGIVALRHAPDMAPVFARSSLFVSTQALENFTSLSMLEAMAAGNAIVAADVGQTGEFVQHGRNGLLAREETPDAFASAMADYLAHPEWHAPMAAASRHLATTVHTIDHFADDIWSFWRAVRDGGRGR